MTRKDEAEIACDRVCVAVREARVHQQLWQGRQSDRKLKLLNQSLERLDESWAVLRRVIDVSIPLDTSDL